MSQLLELIYNYPSLKDFEIQKIIEQHTCVTLKKGEFLLKEGQISKEYYILTKGLVRSYVIGPQGHEITTGFCGENEVVIEVASVFGQVPTQEYYQCLTDCTLYKIIYDDFQKLFLTIPAFAEWGRMWMTAALTQQKDRMLNMLTQSAQDRYISLLEHNPQVFQIAQLKHIASYLGITDTSLSRIRKEINK